MSRLYAIATHEHSKESLATGVVSGVGSISLFPYLDNMIKTIPIGHFKNVLPQSALTSFALGSLPLVVVLRVHALMIHHIEVSRFKDAPLILKRTLITFTDLTMFTAISTGIGLATATHWTTALTLSTAGALSYVIIKLTFPIFMNFAPKTLPSSSSLTDHQELDTIKAQLKAFEASNKAREDAAKKTSESITQLEGLTKKIAEDLGKLNVKLEGIKQPSLGHPTDLVTESKLQATLKPIQDSLAKHPTTYVTQAAFQEAEIKRRIQKPETGFEDRIKNCETELLNLKESVAKADIAISTFDTKLTLLKADSTSLGVRIGKAEQVTKTGSIKDLKEDIKARLARSQSFSDSRVPTSEGTGTQPTPESKAKPEVPASIRNLFNPVKETSDTHPNPSLTASVPTASSKKKKSIFKLPSKKDKAEQPVQPPVEEKDK